MSAFITAVAANRPNVGGLMLLIIALSRYVYAIGYQSNDVGNRFPAFLVSQFAASVGVGYAALVGLSVFQIGPFTMVENIP